MGGIPGQEEKGCGEIGDEGEPIIDRAHRESVQEPVADIRGGCKPFAHSIQSFQMPGPEKA
jgi:hypothetical protein